MKYCKMCGFNVETGEGFYKYCPNDGELLIKDTKCKCGVILNPDNEYCINCGNKNPIYVERLEL